MRSLSRGVLGVSAVCAFGQAMAVNLIVNGDFEAGNTGFTSEYTFVSTNSDQGQYTVASDPSSFNPGFASFADNTLTGSLMMVVNGATTAGKDVWSQTVTVTPGTPYVFAAWGATAVEGGPAVLRFSINGTQMGTDFTLLDENGVWTPFAAVWFSGSASSATITIEDVNTASFPNDFAMDDLSFHAVPEPASAIALGLPALLLLRRKRKL